ncbi:SusC/RagA family TonB-linked outer membrane protein [Cesiribacter sp. SM1]|uniref:SusC/RagA family TonB-linked outer membrane protein n=1 Tax=Cesiribacter sp. SM1 TaxID=2861196 RepID=UPI001CD441A5|nr:SusC/RagA family TonB-linked outer membrane protein [Cesiribacter sp. SM1]
MKRILLAGVVWLMAIGIAWAQRTVSGTVVSRSDGQGLPGVAIKVKGTAAGTITDLDGTYKIEVPAEGAVLVYSFVGYTVQEIPVGNQSVIDVQLAEDVETLSEVVVTALGIERSRNELSYAAEKVEGTVISQQRDANFINSLSGRVPGLNIRQGNTMGGSANVIIRGATSLTGNNQALFVIDGVPVDNSNTNTNGSADPNRNQQQGGGGYDYGNAASDINPDDIESVNVLKGAAATALYGSRAANGVVLITTKKGSKNKGIGVSVNSGVFVGFVDKSTFPKYQTGYGAGYGASDHDRNPATPDEYYWFDGNGADGTIVNTNDDGSFGAPFDPQRMVYHWDAFDPSSPNFGKKRPWVAAENGPITFFRNPVSTNNSIFLDGGSEKATYKLGYTRNSEEGILPNSQIKKNLVNFSASYDVSSRLKATASVNFSNIEGLGRYGTGYDGSGGRNLMTGFREWWQVNVDLKEQEQAYFRNRENITWNWLDPTVPREQMRPAYWDNPYWTRYENYQNDERKRYFGYAMLNYKLNDWLDVMGRISLDTYDEMQEERIAIGSVGVSEYTLFNRSFAERNYDLMLSFNKDLSEVISFKGLVGTNIRRTEINSVFAQTNGGLLIPRLYALLNSANPIEAPAEVQSAEQVNGLFANTTLGYKELLFLDLALRRDQSSTLPQANNAYYYPSVSSSFVFSELMKESPLLTYGKLRLNYAEVGNAAPVYYVDDTYDVPTGINGIPLASLDNVKRNPDLKPERNKSFEIGVETSYLDGRLGFDLTYYNSRAVDQIVPLPVSRSTGYDFKIVNAGEIENKGVELSAFAYPVRNKDFSWKMGVNWTRNRNKVLSLGETDNLQIASFQSDVTLNAAVGEPYGTLRGSDFVYVNGQPLVEEGHYVFSDNSNNIIGDINPDWTGGLTNTLKYKGIGLDFLIDVQKGGDVYSLDMAYGLLTGIYEETAGLNDLGNPVRNTLEAGGGVILPGVNADGTPNTTRIPVYKLTAWGSDAAPSRQFVYDASYVKLRQLALTYSLPEKLMSRIGLIKGVDVSLVGRNLWIIHKNLPYADPEAGLSAGNIHGYQVGVYPTTRNIGFNIKVNF